MGKGGARNGRQDRGTSGDAIGPHTNGVE